MSDKHRTVPKNRPDLLVVEQFVGEFFALADQVLVDSDGALPINESRKDWAQRRLDHLVAAQQTPDSPGARLKRHGWLIDVLDDLVTYAENEHLEVVKQRLEDTKTYLNDTLEPETTDQD